MWKKLLLATALFLPPRAWAQTVFNSASIPTQAKPAGLALTGAPSTPVAIFTAGSHGALCWGGMLN